MWPDEECRQPHEDGHARGSTDQARANQEAVHPDNETVHPGGSGRQFHLRGVCPQRRVPRRQVQTPELQFTVAVPARVANGCTQESLRRLPSGDRRRVPLSLNCLRQSRVRNMRSERGFVGSFVALILRVIMSLHALRHIHQCMSTSSLRFLPFSSGKD